MSEELKQIKNKYGENMMHLCRDLFSTILETPGLLFELLSSNFEYFKFLYDDIVENNLKEEFKNYIYSLVDFEKKEIITNKTPAELLIDAGYDLYECKTEEEIQSFKKYYKKGEELCTFNGNRLDRCYVFFAVKKNVEEIKRENFKNPKREDEYGTSVISIQFSKGNINTLSIKNRYNHIVNNSDATYSNNLENIIPGLTQSFRKEYNFNINQNNNELMLPNYVKANDGKYYKYNFEVNNIYYCPNNIIIDNFKVIKKYEEKEKYILIDYFILDLVNKRIELYDKNNKDSFIDGLQNINKIDIKKKKETNSKIINITDNENNNIIIEIDKTNNIIGYKNDSLTDIGDYFLFRSKYLKKIELSNLTTAGNCFLFRSKYLEIAELPNLITVKNYFLYNNECLKNIELSSLIKIGTKFLEKNEIARKACYNQIKNNRYKTFLENSNNKKYSYFKKLINYK
jgi:hypothetical protein